MRTGHRCTWQVVTMVILSSALGALPIPKIMPLVAAQSTDLAAPVLQTGFSAALHEGDCVDIDALAAPLTHATVPSGPPVGNPDALPVANSFTTIPLPLDTIRASDHVIVVADSAVNGAIACGVVGGFLRKDGSLAIGLASVQSSGVDGIAFLTPSGDGESTGVSLFVTMPGTLTQASVASEPAAVLEAEQVADAAPFRSGGLGLTVDEFRDRYGIGEPHMRGEDIETENGEIIFTATTDGMVDTIEHYFARAVSLEDARVIGLLLAPADAVLEETYPQPGATVDLFTSPALAPRFSPTRLIGGTQFSTWPNGKPGQFTISYEYDNAATGIYNVTRIVIELGNDP